MGKRQWKYFGRRFTSELNNASGYIGVSSLILSILSWLNRPGITASILAIFFFILSILITAYVAYKAIPPLLVEPSKIVSQTKPFSEFKTIDLDNITKIAIVGTSQVGKSTLIDLVFHRIPLQKRTHSQNFTIAALQTNPIKYVAIFDGRGGMLADQFAIADGADYLCLLLDHNESNTESSVDHERICSHRRSSEQIRDFLQTNSRHLKHVHILCNKQDLWGKNKENPTLEEFLEAEYLLWRNSGIASRVTTALHSNHSAVDISKFVQEINEFR